jgi:hypothetical protein
MVGILSRPRVLAHFASLVLVLPLVGSNRALAAGPDISFDFAHVVDYRDVTPDERLKQYPNERLVRVKLPISVRFQGLASGEVELLDFEIDGTSAGLRVDCFLPKTLLASEATGIESTTTTKKSGTIGATLGGSVPVPVGSVVSTIAPSITTGLSRSDEDSEKIHKIPPKQPLVVSGTFAQGRGVFFKFKKSTQTTFEGVHELEITFVAPVNWKGGGIKISCTARGHQKKLWTEEPVVFTHVDEVIQLFPEGNTELRKEANERLQSADTTAKDSSVARASFFQEAAAGLKHVAKQAVAEVSL